MTYCFSFLVLSALMGLALAGLRLGWWFFEPRLRHERAMQSPYERQMMAYQTQSEALSLQRQKLELERMELEMDRYVTETAQMARMVKLNKGQSVLLDGQLFHAPQPSDGVQNVLPPPQAETGDPVALMLEALHLMVIGSTGGGKTTLMHHLVTSWAKVETVIVLDFDYANGMWDGAQIFTEAEVKPFCRLLVEEFEARKQLRQGGHKTQFDCWRIVIDEYSAVSDDKAVRSVIELLIRRGRKYNMGVTVGIQDNQVVSLGWEGKGQLRSNFCYTVEAKREPTRGQRTLTLTPWLSDPITYNTPHLPDPEKTIQPIQSPRGMAAESSDSQHGTEYGLVLDGYRGREREVAVAVLEGWSKTKTRKEVTGGNGEIGKLYDKIEAEIKQKLEAIKSKKSVLVWQEAVTGNPQTNGEVAH